jgi:hypothetical protein
MRAGFHLVVLLVLVSGFVSQETNPRSFGVSGLVQYPDGRPSRGATVTGTTACDGEQIHLVQTTKTSNDGSFHLEFTDSGCHRVQLRASNIDDLWLKTGFDVFYPEPNGTAPIVEAATIGTSTETVITLGERGALVHFRVWDRATQRFIWALVHVGRLSIPGAHFGSMEFATGRDGTADPLFLPAGEYEFSVAMYACNGKDYLVANPAHETLRVEAGERLSKGLSLDVRQVQPLKSDSNRDGKPCDPKAQADSGSH